METSHLICMADPLPGLFMTETLMCGNGTFVPSPKTTRPKTLVKYFLQKKMRDNRVAIGFGA